MNNIEFNKSMDKVDKYMETAKYYLNIAADNLNDISEEDKVHIDIPNMRGGTSQRYIDKSDIIKQRITTRKATKAYQEYKDIYGE